MRDLHRRPVPGILVMLCVVMPERSERGDVGPATGCSAERRLSGSVTAFHGRGGWTAEPTGNADGRPLAGARSGGGGVEWFVDEREQRFVL
jgi:hypothetical protein